MSRLGQLPLRDLELLSAYVDGMLKPRESSALEARLKEDEALAQALAELRQTVQAVRALPKVRPPRSFTLTPEMVGLRERRRPYPLLQLATALTTMAFLVVSGMDVLSRGLALGASAPAAAPMQLAVAPSEEAPMLQAAEEAVAASAAAGTASDLAATPTLQPEMRSLAPGTPFSGMGGGPAETPVAAEAEGLETAPAATAVPETEAPVEAEAPAPAAEEAPPPPASENMLVAVPPKAPPPTPFIWLEIGLGATVLLFAFLTLRVRRKR